MDFFVLKGWVETLLNDLGTGKPRFTLESDNPSYHPGRCARISVGDTELGVLGQIHPEVAANYGVDAELYCAELRFDALLALKGALPVFKPLPRFPSVSMEKALTFPPSNSSSTSE